MELERRAAVQGSVVNPHLSLRGESLAVVLSAYSERPASWRRAWSLAAVGPPVLREASHLPARRDESRPALLSCRAPPNRSGSSWLRIAAPAPDRPPSTSRR